MERLKSAFAAASGYFDEILKKLQCCECLTDSDTFRIVSSMDTLQKEQNRCINEVCALVFCTREQCTSVDKMEELIRLDQLKKEQEARTQKLRNLMEDFCRVTGEGDYGFALSEFQDKARSFEDSRLAEMEAEGELELYRHFLECVNSDRLETGDVECFIPGFNITVAFGLLAHKYALDLSEKVSEQAVQSVSSEQALPDEASCPQPAPEPEAAAEMSQPSEEPEKVFADNEELSNDEVPAGEEDPNDSCSQYLEHLKQALIDEDQWPELVKISPQKKPRGESSLLSYCRKSGPDMPRALSFVAESLLNAGCRSKRFLQNAPGQEHLHALTEKAVSYLVKEGFLYGYHWENTPEDDILYCLTEHGHRVLTRPGITKLLHLKPTSSTVIPPFTKASYLCADLMNKFITFAEPVINTRKFCNFSAFTNSNGTSGLTVEFSDATELIYYPLIFSEEASLKEILRQFLKVRDSEAFPDGTLVVLETAPGQQAFWQDFLKEIWPEGCRFYIRAIGEEVFQTKDGSVCTLAEILEPFNNDQTAEASSSASEEITSEDAAISPAEESDIPEDDGKSDEDAVPTEVLPDVPDEEKTAMPPVLSSPLQAEPPISAPAAEQALSFPDCTPAEEQRFSAPAGSSAELAGRLLGQSDPLEDQSSLKALIRILLTEGKVMEAAVLSKTLVSVYRDPWFQTCCQDLVGSTGLPLDNFHCQEYLESEPAEPDALDRYCRLSASIRALCFPQNAYDHNLYISADTLVGVGLNDWIPEGLLSVKSLFALLTDDLKELSFKFGDGLGLSEAILGSLSSDAVMEKKRSQLMHDAQEKCSSPRSNIGITGYETMLKSFMGPAGEMGLAMKAVAEDDISRISWVQELVQPFLASDATISDNAIDACIDELWNEQKSRDRSIHLPRFSNDSPARNYCHREIRKRLSIACEWIRHNNQNGNTMDPSVLERIKTLVGRIEKLLQTIQLNIEDQLPDSDITEAAGLHVLQHVITRIGLILQGSENAESDPRQDFAPLLTTGEIALDCDGLPIIDTLLNSLPGMEPWRMMLRHLSVPGMPLAQVLPCLEEGSLGSPRYEDYGSAAVIRSVLNLPAVDYSSSEIYALTDCNESENELRGDVRLACAYGQMAEETKETIFAQIAQYRPLFIGAEDEDSTHHPIGNYAHYRTVLACLRQEMLSAADVIRSHYMQDYSNCLRQFPDGECPPILEQIRKEIDSDNFAMAEEYMTRFTAGERDIPADNLFREEVDFHNHFIANADRFIEQCEKPVNKGRFLINWAPKVLQQHNFWTSGNERNVATPADYWITQKGDSKNATQIIHLMQMLGIQITQIEKSRNHPTTAQYEVFCAKTEPVACNREDYPHPVMKFGTQLPSVLHIVCVYGCKGSSTLIDIMTNKLQLGGAVIVLMDGVLTILERRRVAAQFKGQTSGQNSFLLLDRVLTLYLSALDSGNRSKAFLQCTLPYTYEQLYTEGAGAVADEMFIGRIADRKSLSDPQGACLVYGGRQLGKTALLQRVRSINNDPNKRYYSVYLDIKEHTADYFIQVLRDALNDIVIDGTPLADGTEQSIYEICRSLTRNRNAFDRLIILVDEVDRYFEQIAKENYNPLHPIIVMQDELKNKVKFVFAGTHNVAATRKATEDNSDIVKLRPPLCIQPLSTADATRLIRTPLSYLGFHIGEQQIALILANTNSYPGLIHLFCNELIKSVCENYSHYYSETRGNPPYTVSDEQLKAIFRATDIKKEIETRVMATIKVDREYRIVSNILAYMEYEDTNRGRTRLFGYTPEELQQCNVREFGIHAFLPEQMESSDLAVLMDEMQTMGILWKNPDTSTYRFRQRDFIGYIGSQDQVMYTLLKEGEAE